MENSYLKWQKVLENIVDTFKKLRYIVGKAFWPQRSLSQARNYARKLIVNLAAVRLVPFSQCFFTSALQSL